MPFAFRPRLSGASFTSKLGNAKGRRSIIAGGVYFAKVYFPAAYFHSNYFQ